MGYTGPNAMLAHISELEAEVVRLQTVIDSRPAINAELPESYIKWSQSIYLMEASRVTQTPS